MSIRWYEQGTDSAKMKSAFRGRPCQVIAVGVEEGCNKVGFLKALVDGEEIICEKNEDGDFLDLTYDIVEH
jgi:hypothetical protein